MKLVIYDCDNTMGLPGKEIDDGLTLLYLLGRPDIRLLGVTTTFGNGTTDQAYAQTRELLARFGRPDIPVFRGQAKPGQEANEAAAFLAAAAAGQPGQISLLATGPLTNLRAAARIDDRFCHNLREIACMGGYLAPLRIGWRRLPELNLSADPEAAQAVLTSACPVTLMSAQLCLQASFSWKDLIAIRHLDPWLRRAVRDWLFAFGLYCGVSKFYLWDLAPAVWLSYPELFHGPVVSVASAVSELSVGTVVTKPGNGAGDVLLPGRIRDMHRLKRVIFEAWTRACGADETREE
jgi:inosine-uridine nucleoside N-ribohydrolase